MEKKTFLKIGFALLCAEIGFYVITFLYYGFVPPIIHGMFRFQDEIGTAVTTALGPFFFYGIMALIIWLFIRRIPEIPQGEKSWIPLSMLLVMYLMCQGLGYLLAMGGFYVQRAFQLGLIPFLENFFIIPAPVEHVDSTGIVHVADVFCTIIMAPVCEEFIFRKLLLDKLKPFGDTVAILFTAITFGLTHMNFQQFFFAAFTGLIFGYVAIRTGRLLYPILLHFFFNTMSAVVMPLFSSIDDMVPELGSLIGNGVYFGLMVIGSAMFFCIFKKIKLNKAPFRFTRPLGGAMLGNSGIILYLILCVLLFVFNAALNVLTGYYDLRF